MTKTSRIILANVVAGLVFGGGFISWRSYAARQAWQAMRPPMPVVSSTGAPGLQARLTACSQRLQSNSPDRAALAEFALLCHANGFVTEAATAYRGLIQLDPNEARWPHLLATILAGYGELGEALPLLQRATQLAPDHIPSRLRLGDVLLKTNNAAGAEAAYQEVLHREPENPYALLGLARCDLQAERWTAARAHLQQAVKGAPNFSAAQHLLATVQERLGNPAAAAAALSHAAQGAKRFGDAPDGWIDELVPYCHDVYQLLVTASAAASSGSPRQAMPALERAVTLAPDDARVRRQFGNTLDALGDLNGAREQLTRAIALSPGSDYLYLDLIPVLHEAHDEAAVDGVITNGLAACPTSAGLHFEAGMVAVRREQWDVAIPHLEITWKSRPDEVAAPAELAKAHFRQGHSEAGVAVLEQFLADQPRDLTALLMLVRYGIGSGDARTAVWLERAAAAGGPSATLTELRQAYHRRFGAITP
ncbi:MAG TPA: tetratricopeptide repeat protein [Candidatus Didemnitutus sp.]|nr:tetratricopeptide repeat protein [Candidatus Didemnitutus sp.]